MSINTLYHTQKLLQVDQINNVTQNYKASKRKTRKNICDHGLGKYFIHPTHKT